VRRLPRVVGVTVLGAALVGGCGEDDGYCAALEEEQEVLVDLAGRPTEAGGDVLTPTLAAFERLRAEAPEVLADEYDTVVFAYRALAEAVEDAGLAPEDVRPGERPEGLRRAEARRLAAVAHTLATDRVRDAAAGIETHARDACGVELAG
jgi:hypothetical protein